MTDRKWIDDLVFSVWEVGFRTQQGMKATQPTLKEFKATINQKINQEFEELLAEINSKYEESKRSKSRPQWSKDNETSGEAYSRKQGFLSGLITSSNLIKAKIKEKK